MLSKDRDGDGKVTLIEVAENMGEAVADTLPGRWEQNVLVPAASGSVFGIATTLFLLAIFWGTKEWHGRDEYRMLAGAMGLAAGSLFVAAEMIFARAKVFEKQYQRGYDDAVEEMEAKYQAQITLQSNEMRQLQRAMTSDINEDNGDEKNGLSYNELKAEKASNVMIEVLYMGDGHIGRDRMANNYGITKAPWMHARNVLLSLGIIDKKNNRLVQTYAEAQMLLNNAWDEKRHQKTTREGWVIS